jgi:beta-glucanase (GH16 family)
VRRRHRAASFCFVLLLLIFLLAASSGTSSFTSHPTARHSSRKLSWADEFAQADGSAPDPNKWTYDLGGDGWGNQELETYTSRRENARIEGGKLVLTAIAEEFTGRDGVKRHYTSARLKSQGLFDQAYGRFEARIQVPAGQGIWPAFWLLGADIDQVGWPKCGEIDIMENIGREPEINHGSLHGPSTVRASADLTGTKVFPVGDRLSHAFHLYAVEWEPQSIHFYVDDDNYATFSKEQWPAGGQWVFDHPFFIVLNVAVGGNWPGNPDMTTRFPQEMLVDYVRVYEPE